MPNLVIRKQNLANLAQKHGTPALADHFIGQHNATPDGVVFGPRTSDTLDVTPTGQARMAMIGKYKLQGWPYWVLAIGWLLLSAMMPVQAASEIPLQFSWQYPTNTYTTNLGFRVWISGDAINWGQFQFLTNGFDVNLLTNSIVTTNLNVGTNLPGPAYFAVTAVERSNGTNFTDSPFGNIASWAGVPPIKPPAFGPTNFYDPSQPFPVQLVIGELSNGGSGGSGSSGPWQETPTGTASLNSGITNVFISGGSYSPPTEDSPSKLNIIQTSADYAIVFNDVSDTNLFGYIYYTPSVGYDIGMQVSGDLVFQTGAPLALINNTTGFVIKNSSTNSIELLIGENAELKLHSATGQGATITADTSLFFSVDGSSNFSMGNLVFEPIGDEQALCGTATHRWIGVNTDSTFWGGHPASFDSAGSVDPNGNVVADPGSVWRNTSAGTLWVKTNGVSNTGWGKVAFQ